MNLDFFILINKTFLITFILDRLTNFIISNNFFKQYTIWNLISLIISQNYNVFLLNTISIFLLFHSIFFFEPELYLIMAKKINLNLVQFNIANILLHFIPMIYSFYLIHTNKIDFILFDLLDNFIYLFIWAFVINFDFTIYSLNKKYYIHFFLINLFSNLLLIKMI